MGTVPKDETRWIKLNLSEMRTYKNVPKWQGFRYLRQDLPYGELVLLKAKTAFVKQKATLDGREVIMSSIVRIWEDAISWHQQIRKRAAALGGPGWGTGWRKIWKDQRLFPSPHCPIVLFLSGKEIASANHKWGDVLLNSATVSQNKQTKKMSDSSWLTTYP